MIKEGAKVYVVEGYLVEEQTDSLLAGEIGLAVIFEDYSDSARVHVTDHNGVLREIPPTAICRVPEGHLSNLYREPCPACGLRLFAPHHTSSGVGDEDVLRRYLPPLDLESPFGARIIPFTVENLIRLMHRKYPEIEDDCDDKHPMTAVGVVLLAAAIMGTTDHNALIRFTGYSRDFISAITFNMQNNRLWVDGHYQSLDWLLPKGVINDDRFWEHVEIACGMLWFSEEYTDKFVDPCAIYWEEVGGLE